MERRKVSFKIWFKKFFFFYLVSIELDRSKGMHRPTEMELEVATKYLKMSACKVRCKGMVCNHVPLKGTAPPDIALFLRSVKLN
jgi:hypothetical protein